MDISIWFSIQSSENYSDMDFCEIQISFSKGSLIMFFNWNFYVDYKSNFLLDLIRIHVLF
jgi:hypothetical protein